MATDHLGREIPDSTPEAQTVTGFAVEQGTLDAGDPDVQAELDAEEARAKAGTEHAERVSEQMAGEDAGEDTGTDAGTVPPEAGGGRG
jgi:hypothetical protein